MFVNVAHNVYTFNESQSLTPDYLIQQLLWMEHFIYVVLILNQFSNMYWHETGLVRKSIHWNNCIQWNFHIRLLIWTALRCTSVWIANDRFWQRLTEINIINWMFPLLLPYSRHRRPNGAKASAMETKVEKVAKASNWKEKNHKKWEQ